ncbi:is4 transposase (fragment) protein [Xanthomonas fragariae]|uniref:Is4 transposase protein n=2 Tax=Xanthomonas fragariae TaxID=48664 RepID=A0A1Y6H2K7_9XANT
MRSLVQEVQPVSDETVKVAFAKQSGTGQDPAQTARGEGIERHTTTLQAAKKGVDCFHEAECLSAASGGQIVSDASHATMSACQKTGRTALHRFATLMLMLGNAPALFPIS